MVPLHVVKIGGREGNEPANVVEGLRDVGPCVLVHGGSSAVDELAKRLGRPARFLTSPQGFVSRYTDGDTVDLVAMAIAGRMNTALVSQLQAAGIPALGLSGVDGRTLVGRRKNAIRAIADGRVTVVRDDRSGTVEHVNTGLLSLLLGAGYVPVLSPPILDGDSGLPLNADADRIASKVASALGARTLVLLTNVPGLLRAPDDAASLVARLDRSEIPAAVVAASGGMKKKLLAARDALDGGVHRVVIADSRRADPIRAALRGEGTVIA